MTYLSRLRVLTAVLGVSAASAAVGTYLFGDFRPGPPAAKSASGDAGRPDGNRVTEELAQSRFSALPTVTYRLRNGETLFAWQVKPVIAAAPARPRDFVVVVDTSASQAGLPLRQARHVIQGLAQAAGPDDRFAVWTANTPKATRPLTKDFVAGNSDELRNAATALTEVEYGSGAVDLKGAVEKAAAAVPHNRGRQQVILFLGDGESAYAPLNENDRVALGGRLEGDDLAFFAVPLGVKVDPQNLHGLASLTGGAVVRLQEDVTDPSKRAAFVARLAAAVDVPVLKPEKYSFGAEVAEAFPTKLPPLRADRATLVIGRLAGAPAAVTAKVSGKVAGRPTDLAFSEALLPAQADHYFLNVMLDQWKGAPHTDAPAMLQADRALALASTQVKLYRDEFLTQAVWAVTLDKIDDAGKLYAAAKKIDPNDAEAAAGLKLVERMKAGKLTKADLSKRVSDKVNGTKVSKDEAVRLVFQEAAAAQDPPAPAPGAPGVVPAPLPAPAPADLLREAQARRLVEEQRYRVLVDTTISRARRLLRTDPDAAYTDLKRQRDEVLAYDALGDAARRGLVADLEVQMRDIMTKGGEIKRQAAEERTQIARSRQRLNEFDRQTVQEDQTKARIDAFRQLMQQARYELAYQEAQLMIQERTSRGLPVPPQATASYIIGQQATNLRESRELIRVKEDRFLLTMLQVEKSAIPYPDEPPVHFPPASVWRELTGERRERYTNAALGSEPSPTQKRLQNSIENQRVVFEGDLNNFTLIDLLQTLSKKYDLTFIINEDAFKADMIEGIRDKKPQLTATRLDGLTLGSFLDITLGSMGASFIVRPDYVEITTQNKRLEEKVTRAFPVADLVIPIPNSVALSGLTLNLSVQGATAQTINAAQPNANLGIGLGNNGGGGGLGQGGGLPQGGQFPNLGQGGNFVGIQGGQNGVGQFGNLGGQFGIQGATQERDLINLIIDTVARGEWKNSQPAQDPNAPMIEELAGLNPKAFNSLGYYGPARALTIRGSSRYHPNSTIQLKPGGGMAALPVRGGPAVAAANPAPAPAAPAAGVAVAAAGNAADPARNVGNARVAAQNAARPVSKDPKKMWHDVIAGTIEDPGMIVAASEFLMDFNEYGHAAEVLKANLRKGLATDAWAHEALAVALQAAQASPDEVERAALSAVDLDPTDPKAYLRAAKAESDLKRGDLAVGFCKRAAALSPGLPGAYANALVYAGQTDGVKADVVLWAADNLLSRDWPADGNDYQAEAKRRVEAIAGKFEAAGRGAEAAPLRKSIAEDARRDLVIELLWTGAADLDLVVTEPTGAVCDATRPRTSGGGVLKADQLDQRDAADVNGEGGRSELYAAASAFAGTYKVAVKKVFGNPVGGTALVKVTKFKGTPKQVDDIITVDFRGNKPVEVALDGGSRTEMAAIPAAADEGRLSTTGAPLSSGPSGFGGGFGTAGSMTTGAGNANAGSGLPLVNPAVETRQAGASAGAADLRRTATVNPDRRTMRVTVNPVFAGLNGSTIPLPKVDLLPGGDAR